MASERVTYLDSSAIVKLAIKEPESAVLRQFLRRRRPLVSSAMARAEVLRAALQHSGTAVESGRSTLRQVELVRVSDRILVRAGEILPQQLRTLDAIHLATAEGLGDQVARIVTYDERLAAAAQAMGWTVAAPA
jgi:predicted nucleic acid-binding protein